MRDLETNALVEDAEVRNMELQMQKKLFEQVCVVVHLGFLEWYNSVDILKCRMVLYGTLET